MEQQKELVGTNSSNNKSEFVAYLKDIAAYAKRTSPCDNSDMKKRIGSFTTLFAKCENKDELRAYLSKAVNVITNLYSKLSEYIHQHEPKYVQEFHWRWKEILCCIKFPSLAKSCERNIPQMNFLVGRLLTATHRLEQIPILSVLMLYIQNIRPAVLKSGQFENGIFAEIAQISKIKSHKIIHNFLSYANVDGENIFTVKPTRATPIDFGLDYFEQKQEVWLDFNLKNESVIFIVHSVRKQELLCLGIVSSPRIQHYLLHKEYLLSIRGCWTLLHGGVSKQPGKNSKFMFSCHVNDKVKIDSLKGRFKISEYLNYDTKPLQDEDLESVGAKTATIFFCDTDSDDEDQRSRTTPVSGGVFGRISPELTTSDNDCHDSDNDCWRYILNGNNEISQANENFDRQLSSATTDGSLGVNYGSNEHNADPMKSTTCTFQQREETIFEETDLGRITTRRLSKFVVQKTVHQDKTRTSRKVFMSIDCQSRDVQVSSTKVNTAESEEPSQKRSRLNVHETVHQSRFDAEPRILQDERTDRLGMRRRIKFDSTASKLPWKCAQSKLSQQ